MVQECRGSHGGREAGLEKEGWAKRDLDVAGAGAVGTYEHWEVAC